MNHYDFEKREDEIHCPYCNFEFGDSWEYGDSQSEDIGELECPNCDKKFHASRSISVSYVTNPDCHLNDEEHERKLHRVFDDMTQMFVCIKCGDANFKRKIDEK